MSDGKAYVFGDVIRADPTINEMVPQPDDRRWMIISFDDRNKWTTFYIGPMEWTGPMVTADRIVHWNTLYGFIRVEAPE